MDDYFGGKHILDREISAVYLYEKPVNEADLRLQAEEVESVCWIDFERLKELAAAGAKGYCFPVVNKCPGTAFQGVTEYEERSGYH